MRIEEYYRKIRIHSSGYKIILVALLISFILRGITDFLGSIAVLFTLFSIYFFRDPARVIPVKDNIVVSPADGLIKDISTVFVKDQNSAIEIEMQRISIFLSVMDVHVNRIPVSGEIKNVEYFSGKFVSATFDKASEDNERNLIVIKDKNGDIFRVVQIAGFISRRIECYVKIGDNVAIGDRFGIIKFGSSVDLYIPSHYQISASCGQTVIAGESIVAVNGNVSAEEKNWGNGISYVTK